jgi:AraC-like DNA-binding protein
MTMPATTAPPPETAATHAALIAPCLPLAACVRAYVTRSTLGAELREDQRFNHFPASPLCSIIWRLQGDATMVQLGDTPVRKTMPRLAFAGPHTLPSINHNPGPMQAFILALFPQAVQALTGIDLAVLVNRVVPLEAVLDGAWLRLAHAVQCAPDDHARIQLIEAFLAPRWSAADPGAMQRGDRHRHWVEALAMQAAASGVGKSLRQMERRIKDWAGLPLQDLRRMARADASFVDIRDTLTADTSRGAPDWADVAAQGGFSDQSHFCRETRRISGRSPNGLKRAVREDEGFWMYRLWN